MESWTDLQVPKLTNERLLKLLSLLVIDLCLRESGFHIHHSKSLVLDGHACKPQVIILLATSESSFTGQIKDQLRVKPGTCDSC